MSHVAATFDCVRMKHLIALNLNVNSACHPAVQRKKCSYADKQDIFIKRRTVGARDPFQSIVGMFYQAFMELIAPCFVNCSGTKY